VTLPARVRDGVERAVGRIRRISPVSGGCISQAFRVDTAAGTIFLKHHPEAPPAMFAAEADGLRALHAAADGELRIPTVLALDEAATWIALEWLEPGPRGPDFGERLGRGLAALHRRGAGGWGWGWERANFIGPLAQANEPMSTWAEFWAERRLQPQLEMARAAGRDAGSAADWDRLFCWLPELLAPAEEDGPSLLHGDLWGGNVLSAAGEPALIDPAVYRGHREADLAMAELFGGFGAAFHAAYAEAWPLLPGYAEARRAIYQLYYLLVHVNLFGGGYGAQTAATLRRALGD
jgi:fructosamine-3-kinase